MPSGNVTVTGTFVKNAYTISIMQATGGTISASKSTATEGEEITLSNTPSEGYSFIVYSVKQGTTSVSVANGKFTMPSGNVTVTGTFVKNTYTLSITQPTGGTINANKTTATYGEEITLSNTANEGYVFGSYIVKQGDKEITVTNGKFTMPSGNVTVTGTFVKNAYTISITQPTGGTINANKTTAVSGEEITLSNTANTGYSFTSYIVKQGDTVIEVTNGKFTMPNGNVTISGTFTINQYTVTITQPTGGSITVKNGSTAISSGAKVNYGTTLTLSNSASTGYTFTNYKVGSATQTTTSYKVTGNVTISGTFTINSYAVTITQPTGGSITVKNGSTTLSSGAKVNYGTTLTLSNSASTGYTFTNYKVGSSTQTTTSYKVTGNVTISGTFTINSYAVTITQPTGGSIKANSKTGTFNVNHGTKITLSNTASAGYVFSSYKVNNTSQTSTSYTVTGATTVTGTFNKGIGGLGNFNYAATYNYNSSKTGSISVSGNTVSNSQTYYPSAISWVKGDFYYETEVALNGGKIYNGELYCKLGIVVVSAADVFYGYIDALAKGWNNGGFGNNTWLGYAPGRGSLNGGIDWSFWGSADHCGNFNKNYSSSSTYVKLGLMRVGGLYKFFANDKFMFSVWHPEATSSVQIGLLAFNIGFEAKNSKIGYGQAVIDNANAYYGLTSSLHPTSRTIDGKVDGRAVNDSNATIDISWKENLTKSYGVGDYTRYIYSTAFKGSDGVYIAAKARTKNLITTANTVWEKTNLEVRATGGSNAQVRMFFAADGTLINPEHTIKFLVNGTAGLADDNGNMTSTTGFKQGWSYYQDVDGYYVITIEGKIPYSALGISNSSGAVKMNFAFRSEEVGLNMQDGSDGVWWCGFGWLTSTVNTTGLSISKESTPTEKNKKPGVGGADPFVLPYNNKYYLYATTGTGTGYRVYVSDNLDSWRTPTTQDFTDVGVTSPKTEMKSGWAFHKNWSNPVYYSKSGTTITCKNLWAPEVAYNSTTKKFVMTYSGYAPGNLATVSVATSDSPLGPFIDVYGGVAGFLAPTGDSAKASIDASIFVDSNGSAYLYYCNDCTRNGIENFKGDGVYWGISEIWVVKLDSTWTKTTGTHTRCITPYQEWETQNDPGSADGLQAPNTAWNEGPYVYKHNGTYYMTYSANPYWNPMYGVGLAFAKSPTGPWTKYHANPIVVKQPGKTAGTGHNMFFKDFSGKLWCAYHTYSDPNASGNVNRELLLSRTWFDDGILRVEYGNW